MTEVFNPAAPLPPGPKTHALVIGVGSYRHLPGGTDPRPAQTFGLGQITSPAISARKVADWLCANLNNQKAPLGSVDLLISGASPGPIVEPATMANITQAVLRWHQKCTQDRGNVAMFYFSGHGLERESLALLAEDFAANPLNVFQTAINFPDLREGMGTTCQAATQCFFIDTCRQLHFNMLPQIRTSAATIVAGLLQQYEPDDAPVFMAASRQAQAFAQPNKPSRFTQALLDALDGIGSRNLNDVWSVTTQSLADGIGDIIRRGNTVPGTPQQQCKLTGETIGDTVLHVLGGTPKIPITVTCDPSHASDHAEFRLNSTTAPTRRYVRPPAPATWEAKVEADVYLLDVTFPNNNFPNKTNEGVWAAPPSFHKKVKVQ